MNTSTTFQKKKGLSSSAKSLVQLGNTFNQSGCGCLKKCLQLSILLPLPSRRLHTFPKNHKKKKKYQSFGPGGSTEPSPVRPRVLSLVQVGNTIELRRTASSATSSSSSFSRHDTFTTATANA